MITTITFSRMFFTLGDNLPKKKKTEMKFCSNVFSVFGKVKTDQNLLKSFNTFNRFLYTVIE